MKITITSRNKVTIKLCKLWIASENVKITMNYCKFDQKLHLSIELEKISQHIYIKELLTSRMKQLFTTAKTLAITIIHNSQNNCSLASINISYNNYS